MSTRSPSADGTVLDRLVTSLRDRTAPLDGQARPVAVLWPDANGEWRGLLEALRPRLPELLVLGTYDEASRTGPAIWLRSSVECLGEAEGQERTEPAVIYLPGVSRQQLRAGDDCPRELRPLVELLYRGIVWCHPNGSEWTVRAFLASPRSLGLDVADDGQTRNAMLQALPEVAVMPFSRLKERHLDADFFRRKLSPDPWRDVLHWMGEGEEMRERLGPEKWAAFCSQCRSDLDFDPSRDPDVLAGELLGTGAGEWSRVWERFVEAPANYPQVVEVLRRSRPAGVLHFEPDRWPDLNADQEDALRRTLLKVRELKSDEAGQRIAELEERHGCRRNWVWARLDLSPMAAVLAPLARLADEVRKTLGGGTPDEMAASYVQHGWRADSSAREALATAAPKDRDLVADVVRHLHLPWLADSADAFQKAADREPLPACGEQPPVEADDDVCLLFVDGLRYELAFSLLTHLEEHGLDAELRHRWAALPTVTASGKPAVTPVAEEVGGGEPGRDFTPVFRASGRRADARALRVAMEGRGYQVLGDKALDGPGAASKRGWAECGKIDTLGHELAAADFNRKLRDELEILGQHVERLLEVGWKAVRVVTDHGWLQMPGGLPKVDLPQHLTVSRGARCAALAGASRPDAVLAPWHWNGEEQFATARGIHAFRTSVEYAHGGLSIQECLIPDLRVRAGARFEASARILKVSWRRLRCSAEVTGEPGTLTADLRLKDDLKRSVAGGGKSVEADGAVSLLLADDDHEDSRLVLVLVDEEERILDRRETAVGEDS